MSDNIIQLNQDLIHNELKDLVKNSIEETLNTMLDAEADKLVNAERYARDEQCRGYRVGHYERSFTTTLGDVTLKMPKLKGVPLKRLSSKDTVAVRVLLKKLCGVRKYLLGLSVISTRKLTEILKTGEIVALLTANIHTFMLMVSI